MSKKILVVITLCIVMVFSLVGCGASTKAKSAYDDLNSASEITYDWSNDIYQIWLLSSQSKTISIDKICNDIHGITKDELVEGLVEYIHSHATDWTDDMEDDIKSDPDKYIQVAAMAFSCREFDVCIESVVCAYDKNGKSTQIQKYLDNAKECIKECKNKDYYDTLKDYYSTLNSYYDFCKTPQGSLEQVKTTINDYNNKVRDLKSNLELDLDK